MISSWTFFWLVSTEVGGSQHHQPSGSKWILGSSAYEQYTFNFSHLMRVSVFVKQLKDIVMYISWGETRDAPRLHCFRFCVLDCSSIVSPFPSLFYLNVSSWNSGKFMEAVINNWGTQEDFCDQEPTRFYSLSVSDVEWCFQLSSSFLSKY